jgi:hypothetical protein
LKLFTPGICGPEKLVSECRNCSVCVLHFHLLSTPVAFISTWQLSLRMPSGVSTSTSYSPRSSCQMAEITREFNCMESARPYFSWNPRRYFSISGALVMSKQRVHQETSINQYILGVKGRPGRIWFKAESVIVCRDITGTLFCQY